MGVDERHPLYSKHQRNWAQLRDSYDGEAAVKEAGFAYLPPTAGMLAKGAAQGKGTGWSAYLAYRARAKFPGLTEEAVETILGILHSKEPVIELPDALEPLRNRATLRGESLVGLLRRINEEQVLMGRCGLLAEPVAGRNAMPPKIALYAAESIINWDEGEDVEEEDGRDPDRLNLVVLDESDYERIRGSALDDAAGGGEGSGFNWKWVETYRVLSVGDPTTEEIDGPYLAGIFRETKQFDIANMDAPTYRGKTLEAIPFRFVNTKDIVPTPDKSPMLGLSNECMTIYRGEADYRQSLFQQGQDTLLRKGYQKKPNEGPVLLGAGAVIDVPTDGDAGFIGVDSKGLPEQRAALENDYARGEDKSKGLVESVSRSAESGEALRVRISARTASLQQIAQTGAFALEDILKAIAVWMDANPDEVAVKPNLDFVDDRLKGQELDAVMTAKGKGAPISLESIHEMEQERGLTTITFEEEVKRMDAEANAGLPGALPIGVQDPQGASSTGSPVPDEEDEGDLEAEEEAVAT